MCFVADNIPLWQSNIEQFSRVGHITQLELITVETMRQYSANTYAYTQQPPETH